MVCLCSGKTDEELLCHSSLLSFFKSIPEFRKCFLFQFPCCLVGQSPLLVSIDLVFRIYDVFCDFNVCSASYFSCTLQVNSAATVLLALVVLCTVLAVKSTLFTNSERSVIEMNSLCSYFVLPEQSSWGSLSIE